MFYPSTNCTLSGQVAGVKLYPPILLDADFSFVQEGNENYVSILKFKFKSFLKETFRNSTNCFVEFRFVEFVIITVSEIRQNEFVEFFCRISFPVERATSWCAGKLSWPCMPYDHSSDNRFNADVICFVVLLAI